MTSPIVDRVFARYAGLKAVPFKWESRDTATFIAAGVSFDVYFKSRTINHRKYGPISGYQASFYKSRDKDAPWAYKPTGEGNAMEILGTVIEVVKDFLVKVRPPYVWFVADEPQRARLYNRLVHRMVTPAYEAAVVGEGLYTLRRTKSVFE